MCAINETSFGLKEQVMDFDDLDQMYLNASEEVKRTVQGDMESGDKFAEEILAMVNRDDSGLLDVLAYPELRGLISMVINNSEVLSIAMMSDPVEIARALQLLMYSAIIFERQQVEAKAKLNDEVQRILKESK